MEYPNLILGIIGYKITWKNDHENERTLRVNLNEGLEAMRQWAMGEKVILLRGAAYSTAMIASIEPIEGMCNPGEGGYPLIRGAKIERKLPQMLESGEAMTSEDASKKLKELLSGNELKQLGGA